ncbi:MLP-like protein 43 [Linum perenne]
MSCCSLIHGKLEAYVGVRVGADVFHDIFSCRPHHVSNMAPQKIKACEVHEGEWGKPGTVICWDYFHVIEGDLMKDYKNFKLVVKATPQKKIEGEEWCLVRWILDYEKLKEETPEPFSLLEFVVHTSKDIDDHHTKKK